MSTKRKVTVIEPMHQKIAAENACIISGYIVAAYARVSTEQDEQESSYEAQVNFYTKHITKNPDWELVKVFADRGITGTNTKNRDEFNQMIDLALNGKIDLILTKSISRFARNTVDTLQVVRKLKAAGVEVRFEKENLHTFDPKCEVMLTIMSSLAQEESRSISENIRWARQKSMQNGKVYLPYSRFLGYQKGPDGQLEIVEEEAKIVRSIYDMFLMGKTIRHIADSLTAQGIPTPAGKTAWSVSTVSSILRNEKYKGDALLQKTYTVDYLTKEVRKNDGEVRQYLVENSHPPIIEPEIFNQVQERLKKRRQYRSKIRDNSPFSNKLICGDCGNFYGHKVWHNLKNTERYDVWYCNKKYANDKKCQSPVIREEEIKSVFESVMKKQGKAISFSEQSWHDQVASVIITRDRHMRFLLNDGTEEEIMLPEQ